VQGLQQNLQEGLQQIQEGKLEEKSMSKASYDFALRLLSSMGIAVKIDARNIETGTTGDDPPKFVWTVETKQHENVRVTEHQQTPRAKDWLVQQFLADDGVWGIENVTGALLPELEEGGRKARGKGDLMIGKKTDLGGLPYTNTPYGYAFGLIELKQDVRSIKAAQNMLELASVSMISRVSRNCALLATDCCSTWELYWFVDSKTIMRRQYEHGRKCWEDFEALLDEAETKILPPPSKRNRPGLPNHQEVLDDDEQEDNDSSDQDLSGFDGTERNDDAKQAAVDRHAHLNQLANYLGMMYGEGPSSQNGPRPNETVPITTLDRNGDQLLGRSCAWCFFQKNEVCHH
jgi:hypothetical protein